MDDKEKEKAKKRKRNLVVLFVLAGAIAAAARPAIRFFETLIADGEPTATTFTAAAILFGLIAIVLLSGISGILTLMHWPIIGTAILIFLITVACGMTLYNSVQNMPLPAEKTPGTPRPTVTPPQIEIVTVERVNDNPETGTVFYRRYGNERGNLMIDNGSRSDICFRMVDRHGLLVLIFYVRAGDSCTIAVPTGTYEFRCVTGGEWVDEETYFGDKSHYRRLLETYVFYDGQTEILTLTEGLPEMKTIKEKDFEDTTVGYFS